MALEFLYYPISFIIFISILVFVHEMGHYLAARFSGVKVEKFAIGMGKEVYSWYDKAGTKWCICWLPIGGYVKMYGDSGGESSPDHKLLSKMTQEEKKLSFYFKKPLIKAWIALAGPLANYLFAVIVFSSIYLFLGTAKHDPLVTGLVLDGPAMKSGILVGDRVIEINGEKMSSFYDISKYLTLHGQDALEVSVERNDKKLTFKIKPEFKQRIDEFGGKRQTPMIGIISDSISFEKLGIMKSLSKAVYDCYDISKTTLIALGQIITGKRGLEDLSGPVKIAEYSGKSVKKGLVFVMWFLAMLSINLGLINLLPLPALDGGHIFLNLIEFFSGKKMKTTVQEKFFKLGFLFLIAIMIAVTIKDILGLLR